MQVKQENIGHLAETQRRRWLLSLEGQRRRQVEGRTTGHCVEINSDQKWEQRDGSYKCPPNFCLEIGEHFHGDIIFN